ncbi:hypothetical protein HAU46_08740 [Weissella confusa]|uniref:hypothetical protein n=1 Tax=Weissella confusa TaxID=1583 RepID=UPI0018F18094|nr:hypothetical protein [Weissella confusa]MBJ7648057.1 hypothetical protein [Weissella confusa]
MGTSFKEQFLAMLPAPISRYGRQTMLFAEWLQWQFKQLQDLFTTIEDFRELDNANGEVLDAIGAQYNQLRGEADDSFYRIMIRSKMAINSGISTVNGLLDIIARSLNIPKKSIEIEPLRKWNGTTVDNGEPLAIAIRNIPLQWANTEWEQNYIIDRIRSGVAAGVRVDEVTFVDNSNAVLAVRGISSNTLTYQIYESEDK